VPLLPKSKAGSKKIAQKRGLVQKKKLCVRFLEKIDVTTLERFGKIQGYFFLLEGRGMVMKF